MKVREVRQSQPKHVESFRDLVKEIASISFQNPDMSIFYRGQKKEYSVKKPFCSLYPSILRDFTKSKIRRRLFLDKRYKILKEASSLLLDEFSEMNWEGHSVITKFPEVSWAILQHYEICNTPLLDITTSLRVACSFALQHDEDNGIVYVFGLPNTSGIISYYAYEEIINLRLLSICPPVALRPHYQEGYLVGTFPTTDVTKRTIQYDVSRRLLAKYKITKREFWDNDFQEIPREALFPKNDEMEKVVEKIHIKLQAWCSNQGFQSTLLPSRAQLNPIVRSKKRG